MSIPAITARVRSPNLSCPLSMLYAGHSCRRARPGNSLNELRSHQAGSVEPDRVSTRAGNKKAPGQPGCRIAALQVATSLIFNAFLTPTYPSADTPSYPAIAMGDWDDQSRHHTEDSHWPTGG